MAWTRYDDGFPSHPKTLDVKANCRAALALHLLCNTWSASTDAPGTVPLAAVIEQGGGRAQGLRWARALVAAGMWHAGGHDCARCPEPPSNGYVIHDFIDYNPAIEDVRRKRSEAGRKGAAARWGTGGKPPDDDGNGMANAIGVPPEPHANGMAKNGIARGHPVPVPKPVVQERSAAAASGVTRAHEGAAAAADPIDELQAACTAQGLAVRWDKLGPDQRKQVRELIVAHGVDRLANAAKTQHRPDSPAGFANAWLPAWQALPPPGRRLTAVPEMCPDPAHARQPMPCRLCAADAKAVG